MISMKPDIGLSLTALSANKRLKHLKLNHYGMMAGDKASFLQIARSRQVLELLEVEDKMRYL